MNKQFFLIFCLMINVSELLAAFSPLSFQKKTLEISGFLTPIYRLSDFSTLSHELSLRSEVGAGYFISDRIRVGLSLPAQLNFLPLFSGEAGLQISGSYFFSPKMNIYPYAGLQISPRYSISTQMIKLSAGGHAGVLLGLNEHVTLDLGLCPNLDFRLNSKQKWRLLVPAGFVGIRAFF